MKDTCCEVDRFCKAPPNVDFPVYAKGVCFSCGQSVCSECSSKRKYHHYGTVRLCNSCQIDYDGNDKIVMRRMRKKAGY